MSYWRAVPQRGMESGRIVPASYEAVICKCVLAVILLRRIRHGAYRQFDDRVEEPVWVLLQSSVLSLFW